MHAARPDAPIVPSWSASSSPDTRLARSAPPVCLVPWTKPRPGNENECTQYQWREGTAHCPSVFFFLLQAEAANKPPSQASPKKVTRQATGEPHGSSTAGVVLGCTLQGVNAPCTEPQLHCRLVLPGQALRSSSSQERAMTSFLPAHMPYLHCSFPLYRLPCLLPCFIRAPGPDNIVSALYEADPGILRRYIISRGALGTGMKSDSCRIYPRAHLHLMHHHS